MNLKPCFQITARKQYKQKTLGIMSLQASFVKLNKLTDIFQKKNYHDKLLFSSIDIRFPKNVLFQLNMREKNTNARMLDFEG